MKALIQRVARAAVLVDGETVGAIDHGLLVLVGVGHEDSASDAATLAGRVANLRVFEDGDGKMNLSVLDAGGGLLAVSQFTLMGDTRRGRRPSFVAAAAAQLASPLFDGFVAELSALASSPVATGRFGADMKIDLVADGPVTLMLDTEERRRG